ncbi:MAG: MFS transporter [Clostridia bacterium]|nr:MFS transporter [Clostridia bacterium]
MAKTKVESSAIQKQVPRKETQAYAIAALGQGLVYSCMSSYITDYYMNVLTLNAMFVIMLMLLARVWDAINDPMMGMIVDRHSTKKGRMKPYPLITAIPIAALTILMFVNPGFDTQNKSIWLYVFVAAVYVIWGMVYTASDVPFWSMPNVMTSNPKERGNLISYAKTVGGIGSAVTVALPIIVGYFVADLHNADIVKYAVMAISMSLIGMPLFTLATFKTKERIKLPDAKKKSPGEDGNLKRIFTCKPLMLVVVSGVLSFGRYMLQAAAPHVARYSGMYVGKKPTTVAEYNSNISTVALIIQICAAVGMFGAMLFLPKLYKKFEYKHIMIVSCIAGFAASCLTVVIGWTTKNLLLCIPFMLISSIPLGVINNVSFAMVCDCLDFMEWKTGVRNTGLGSACQSFVNKIGNAFATVMIIGMYMIINLDVATLNSKAESIVNVAMNLDATKQFGMFSLVTIVPGISLLLCAIPLFFYDLTGKKKEQVFTELAELRKERGIDVDE